MKDGTDAPAEPGDVRNHYIRGVYRDVGRAALIAFTIFMAVGVVAYLVARAGSS